MRILYITTIGGTMPFFINFIRELIDEGHTVDIAANINEHDVPTCYREWGCHIYPIPCERSPFKYGNVQAIGKIRKIVSENEYDIVHCHTPIAAACTRIACRKARKCGTKVMYTAHGFHFYKGAPLLNWLIFFPIEWLCSWWTDVLITINKEDFELANKRMHACKITYVPGVGIDMEKLKSVTLDRKSKRKELGISQNDILLVSVGEINKNKNHEVVIRALAEIKKGNVFYLIAGVGEYKESILLLIKELGLENQIRLLGFRNDILELYGCADICVFPSLREGLGMAAIEGIAMGLPLVCGDNRGTREYAIDGENAYVCKDNTCRQYAEAIDKLCTNKKLRDEMGLRGKQIAAQFDVRNVNQQMKDIYFN